jgi:hypothetical protein
MRHLRVSISSPSLSDKIARRTINYLWPVYDRIVVSTLWFISATESQLSNTVNKINQFRDLIHW